MTMPPFTRLRGIAAPLRENDVNTDAIIPSVWLRAPSQNLAAGLFGTARWDAAGRPNPEFVLNQPAYREAQILVAGANFGCGSSREAAVWALLDFGIRCVVAASFADIFYENACKNGLLPATLPSREAEALAADLEALDQPMLDIDLLACTIGTPTGHSLAFGIAAQRREALLSGRDEIAASLALRSDIERFQAADRVRRPWIYREGTLAS